MSAAISAAESERLRELRRVEELRRDFALAAYRPYPKQRAFHAMGKLKREVLFLAANRVGKTKALSCEVAFHMTGFYPSWWEGIRYDYPVRCGIGSKTAELTRDGAQRMLLGEFGKFGTGSIPKGNLLTDWKLSRGVPEAIDIFRVKHKSGGVSIAILKSYKDGREAWQADEWDFAWADEEPPEDIYSEILARTANTKSGNPGQVMLSLTPLLGMSNVVSRFYPDRGHPDRGIVMMALDEAEHFDAEARRKTIEGYLPHEREARTKGIPMLGSGRIYPYTDDQVAIAPIVSIPPLWRRIIGLDFGAADHPTAFVCMAHDDDTNVTYVYDCYRVRTEAGGNVPIHASALRARGADVIPVAWPADGLNETSAGPQLAKQYRDEGINMLVEHAQYDVVPGDSKENPKLARNSVAAGIQDICTRIETGQLKVYSHLNDWFDEFRMYHRLDGKVVKKNDDCLDSLRYGIMMLRFAQNNLKVNRPNSNRGGNWRTF